MTNPKINSAFSSNDALFHSIDARMHNLFRRIECNAQSEKTPPSSSKPKAAQAGLTEEDITLLQARYFRLNFSLDSI